MPPNTSFLGSYNIITRKHCVWTSSIERFKTGFFHFKINIFVYLNLFLHFGQLNSWLSDYWIVDSTVVIWTMTKDHKVYKTCLPFCRSVRLGIETLLTWMLFASSIYSINLWEAESLEVLRPCEAATCVAIFYSAVLVLHLPLLYQLDDNSFFFTQRCV